MKLELFTRNSIKSLGKSLLNLSFLNLNDCKFYFYFVAHRYLGFQYLLCNNLYHPSPSPLILLMKLFPHSDSKIHAFLICSFPVRFTLSCSFISHFYDANFQLSRMQVLFPRFCLPAWKCPTSRKITREEFSFINSYAFKNVITK